MNLERLLSGVSHTGICEFQFGLWHPLSGGNQVGSRTFTGLNLSLPWLLVNGLFFRGVPG
jgi:hypothetical protein